MTALLQPRTFCWLRKQMAWEQAVWTGVYPLAERVQIVSGILLLPRNLITLNLIPVGYPAGPTSTLDEFDPTRILWNGWKQEKVDPVFDR